MEYFKSIHRYRLTPCKLNPKSHVYWNKIRNKKYIKERIINNNVSTGTIFGVIMVANKIYPSFTSSWNLILS